MNNIQFEYFYSKNRQIQTHKKIWLILNEMLYNKDFFKKNNIEKIRKHFKISKKSIIKYMKDYKIKYKNNKEKRLYFPNRIEYQFIKDLEKIRKKYDWLLWKKSIEKWQYYLLNFM